MSDSMFKIISRRFTSANSIDVEQASIKASEWLDVCNYVEQTKARVADLEEIVKESQDWDWLTAKDVAEASDQDFFEITEMQELWERARNGNGYAWLLRKQAEAVEASAEYLSDGDGIDVACQELHEYAQRLRQQADEAKNG